MKSIMILSVSFGGFADISSADRADIIFQRLPMGCVKVIKNRCGPLGVMAKQFLMDEINRAIFSDDEESK